MSIWGKRVDAMFTPTEREPGTPEPAAKRVGVIVVGILVAAAVLFAVYRGTLPSETDCLIQTSEVTRGERVSVDSGCDRR